MSSHRGSVLVVEDDPQVSGVLMRILSQHYDVTVADDGADALWRFEEGQRFDVVLCDLCMPKINGAALIAALQRIDRNQAGRVIVMTGDPGSVIAAGMSSYYLIEKPFDVGALRSLVANVVAAARQGYFPSRSVRG
ncbi:MAG: hybrid sensor histidine kinase/response regulator [bacterium]|nr:hybrid sensor histidine kinase/response regulator [bacterium]